MDLHEKDSKNRKNRREVVIRRERGKVELRGRGKKDQLTFQVLHICLCVCRLAG